MKKAGGRGRKSSVAREARPDYPWPSSPAVSAAMRGNLRVDTRPEMLIRSALHERGLRYRKHLRISLGRGSVCPDVVFPKARVAVFVDGCFWHRCPEHGVQPRFNPGYWDPKLERNTRRDQFVTEALKQAGWTVVRVWEHEPVQQAAEWIASVVRASANLRASIRGGERDG